MTISYAEYKTRGEREEMEDDTRVFLEYGNHFRHISDVSFMTDKALNKDKEYPSFFAIFDGLAGRVCVDYIRDQLPSTIKENINFPVKMAPALQESFTELDVKFLREVAQNENLKDGTTATVVIIWEDKIHVSHVGDCRAVVYHDGKPKVLTTDHTPTIESEKDRIMKYGGKIKKNRINGVLSVSRCFGAYPYKSKETLGEKYVTVQPEIVSFSITQKTDFLVLATDGIWDKLTVAEVMEFIAGNLKGRLENDIYKSNPGRFLYEICQEVTRMANEKKSRDNISIMVITFDHKNNLKTHQRKNNEDSVEISDNSVIDTDVSGEEEIIM